MCLFESPTVPFENVNYISLTLTREVIESARSAWELQVVLGVVGAEVATGADLHRVVGRVGHAEEARRAVLALRLAHQVLGWNFIMKCSNVHNMQ